VPSMTSYVLTLDQSTRWDAVVQKVGEYDFYHTAAYHRLAQRKGEGDPVLIVVERGSDVIAFPLLLRELPPGGAFSPFDGLRDATSVYGYPGPLCSMADPDQVLVDHFRWAVEDFFRESRIVAAFSRLHPLFSQSRLLAGFGEIVPAGITVSIDLTLPPEVQRSRFRQDTRYGLNKLRRRGFLCEEAGREAIEDFVRIYHETMNRVHAEEYYYFDRSYFEQFFDALSPSPHLFVCLFAGTIVAAGLFVQTGPIIQYHLSGTLSRYVSPGPMRLILDTVRLWATDRGARILHLGGGLGGRKDSIYEFKRGFSDCEQPFYVWRHVADPKSYLEVCQAAGCEETANDYFNRCVA
jgi:hypothetical protein